MKDCVYGCCVDTDATLAFRLSAESVQNDIRPPSAPSQQYASSLFSSSISLSSCLSHPVPCPSLPLSPTLKLPCLQLGGCPWILTPTVYPSGEVCISILHPPGDDPLRYESASERWSPVQGVRSVLLSVLSMLAEPNVESGADIEVSIGSSLAN